ncbi:MAG: hypothetical protein ACK50Q_06255 [Labrys sp. (in: a-proteobacteria)]
MTPHTTGMVMMALLVPVAAMLFVASMHLVVIGDAQSGSVGGKCRHSDLHEECYLHIHFGYSHAQCQEALHNRLDAAPSIG